MDLSGQLLASSNAWQIGSGFVGSLDDVRLYRTVLTSSEVQSLYKTSAPTLWMKFDEAEGSTTFANAAGTVSPVCASCPRAGERGRLGSSVSFTAAQAIRAADVNQMNFAADEPFSGSVWVKPNQTQATIGEILNQTTYEFGTGHNYLSLRVDGQVNATSDLLSFILYDLTSGVETSTILTSTVMREQWNHIAVSFNGDRLRLYHNGQLMGERNGVNSMHRLGELLIGTALYGVPTTSAYRGGLDELLLYRAAL